MGPAAESQGDTASACAGLPHGDVDEGWVAVSLAQHPELEAVGGQAAVDVDDALLHVLVVHEQPDCYIAVWRVCTHGACEVSWDTTEANVVCPCHESRFDIDGAVLQGPATEPLAAFEAVRDGDTLWIHRPL
jgi:Rieske Fe-S protein